MSADNFVHVGEDSGRMGRNLQQYRRIDVMTGVGLRDLVEKGI